MGFDFVLSVILWLAIVLFSATLLMIALSFTVYPGLFDELKKIFKGRK